jgi:predicted RNA binding protein YcfA (HicA-like mRNA interferase family)
VKVRDFTREIEADGWVHVRTKGDHRQYKHYGRVGLVTVAGHPNDDIPPGTLNAIMKHAGFKHTPEARP